MELVLTSLLREVHSTHAEGGDAGSVQATPPRSYVTDRVCDETHDLSRHAASLIPTEDEKVMRFIERLNFGIKHSMARRRRLVLHFIGLWT